MRKGLFGITKRIVALMKRHLAQTKKSMSWRKCSAPSRALQMKLIVKHKVNHESMRHRPLFSPNTPTKNKKPSRLPSDFMLFMTLTAFLSRRSMHFCLSGFSACSSSGQMPGLCRQVALAGLSLSTPAVVS